jgi:DNA-binding NtrC family response regulator
VVDDDEDLCDSCAAILEGEGYDVSCVTRGVTADGLLRQGNSDIVLLDLYMSGVPGSHLLRTALETNPHVLVIVMTGKPSVESSIRALRDGAWDYLPKPFSAVHLRVLVGRAAHTVVVARESTWEAESEPVPLVGDAPAFRAMMEIARRVAPTDASVLLTGESGTGKELLARFIHRASRRRSRPMVSVNCAALPARLLESEMFGHVQGAFTGADRAKPGLMEMASGGTLFLDQLAEMAAATQAKLLRVVQDGVVRRLGSSNSVVVNVRFISATTQEPSELVRAGTLREDLLYRLRVVPIEVPPLRERIEDIPLLARIFLTETWHRHRDPDAPVPAFTEAALDRLRERRWTGNIRELRNVVEHLSVAQSIQNVVDESDIPVALDAALGAPPPVVAGPARGSGYHAARDRILAKFERAYASWVLRESHGNVSRAARIAGVNRATLYRILERHGLTPRDLVDE